MTDAVLRFSKYEALGNDYLVVELGEADAPLGEAEIRHVCDRRLGVGADGILLAAPADGDDDFAVRIFNPDGSEAEKSGNGLRIYARYLWDRGRVTQDRPFTIGTLGGQVTCEVGDAGERIRVDIGRASFFSEDIPVAGPPRDVLEEEVSVAGRSLRLSAVTVGNPHCVVIGEGATKALALELGPHLENHSMFPSRTNVQFVEPVDRARLRVEIWERGAGYTLASGTSSCGATAVVHRLGLCDAAVTVEMPGGDLDVRIASGGDISIVGTAERIYDGVMSRAPRQRQRRDRDGSRQ